MPRIYETFRGALDELGLTSDFGWGQLSGVRGQRSGVGVRGYRRGNEQGERGGEKG